MQYSYETLQSLQYHHSTMYQTQSAPINLSS
jgi:hypothetical protein